VSERDGAGLRGGTLEIGIFGAEPWSEAMRREIEARLGIKALDIYGLSEIMGPGVAVECEAQDGLHGWEDHFIFEIIDPDTGRALADGQSGELVVSTLTKQALPMIRYRTRDITRLTRARCACGRAHARLERITGRNDDMLIIRGVNVYPSQIEAVLIGLPDIAPHYQLVVERRGSLDELTIEVESHDPGAAERVRHHVKSMIGVSAAVKVMKPGEVPRSQGKAVRVRDLRPKGG
jgi:phenylacetate-CoA ligase